MYIGGLNTRRKKIVVVGGGLAGLIVAIRLARNNFDCTVIEKKTYPFHRVCGEYISNETEGFLKRERLFPDLFNPASITHLQLSSASGKATILPLGLGGFGISRFTYDNFLFEEAKKEGVTFLLNTTVDDILYNDQVFQLKTTHQTITADLVIGAFGKRSRLDVTLSRGFIKKRSPYVGVKYHALTDQPPHLISLHNFIGGYCGTSKVENNQTNICYLTRRENIKQYGSIENMEEHVLFKNPQLKSLFRNATMLFEKPEVINEISFEQKEPVANHVFMVGDAAGMIAPLCGNGMAMAIHSAKILSDLLIRQAEQPFNRSWLEKEYAKHWQKTFAARLWRGRFIQNKLFGTTSGSSVAVNLILHSRFLANFIVRSTHGRVF